MSRLCFVVSAAAVLLALSHATAQTTRTSPQSLLDDISAWRTISSEGVQIEAAAEPSTSGTSALRIDFDFSKGAGYGGVMLETPMELPENYEFTLTVRGQGPANNLELKLVDESGLNVWWVNRRAFEWPAQATRLSNRRRHFQFAWGPSGGKSLARIGRIELIIAANDGGRGTVWIDDFRFAPLDPEKPYTGTPVVTASSGSAAPALAGKGAPWVASDDDQQPWIAVDFGEPREIGGLVIHRPAEHAPAHFDVEVSDDGIKWSSMRFVRAATGLPSEIALPELQTRWLRLAFQRLSGSPAPSVNHIQFLEPGSAATPNALWRLRASRAARGLYPRHLLGEQSFWTVVGQPGHPREALINEEGQIEVDKRGFSIEPFVLVDRKLLTWADGSHEQSLRDGWAPIPTVIRRHEGVELTVTALAAGDTGAGDLHVAYALRNTGTATARGLLVLAVRPLQVLPPWQDLNITGGWAPVSVMRADENGLLVNKATQVVPSPHFQVAATAYDEGDPVEMLATGDWPYRAGSVDCPERSASGMLGWEFALLPGESVTRLISVPLDGSKASKSRPRDANEFEALAAKVASDWVARVERVKFRLPDAARQFHDTICATQAYILINHDSQGFQPGSRTYERSWMRDGSMTSAAMLELGHDELVKRFIDWYAPFQFPSGKVPCVVDRRGADPVPEHDSNGQLIWLIANAHRYTKDDALVRRHFPRVKAAVAHIESLRAQRLTDEFGPHGPPRQEPGKPPVPALAFRGLVPESISHEGYSAKPMHSFWDTLFILRGLHDAVYLADAAGERDLAARWQKLADDFRTSIIESIRIAQKAHGIDYLPGCVELGDFDSTSSTILLWPVAEHRRFPREWIDATFERYWLEFTRRRDNSPATWEAYTPYELRHVGAYVRLGRKDRAWEALSWFFKHQRPAGWRHWAEVVHRDPKTARMIGDMPHTWCGSDFLNAARAMFAYEDSSQESLVLFAAIPDAWFLDPAGVAFEGLRTEFGGLSASVKPDGADHLVVRIDGTARPPGGFELCSPLERPIRRARMNGREVTVNARKRIEIDALPVAVDLEYEPN